VLQQQIRDKFTPRKEITNNLKPPTELLQTQVEEMDSKLAKEELA